jgi:hypothetical protein
MLWIPVLVLFEKQSELLEEVSVEVMNHLLFHQFKGAKWKTGFLIFYYRQVCKFT